MTGLLIYFVIGSIIACYQILSADEWHEKGYMTDEEYIAHKYFKPNVFAFFTMFWLPAIIDALRNTKES